MAAVANPTEDPRAHIEHLAEHQLIVCKSCRYAIWPEQVQQHYQGSQHRWKKQAASGLAAAVQSWPGVIQYSIELKVPSRVDTAIVILSIYVDGLLCQVNPTQCQYVCRSKKWMIDHCKRKHDWAKQKRRGNVSRGSIERQKLEPWIEVRCQRFFPSRHGSQYFVVGQPIVEEASPRQTQRIVPVWEQADQMMDHAWQKADEKAARIVAKGEANEVNPWLERTGWHRYLVELDREKMSQSIARPDENDELVAGRMWSIMEGMARHCQQTITSRVGHFVRMEAIRTEQHQTKYHPLQPYQNPKSFGDYVRAWQQVLMFFARTKDSKARQRHGDTWKMPKYRFTKDQRQAWRSWNHAIQQQVAKSSQVAREHVRSTSASNITDEESTADDPLLDVLEGLCLKFCISLLDQSITRHEYDSPLVCALAVLGIDQDRWMGPDRYPPILSAIIKISRMMVVQQAWEQCDHARTRRSNSSGSSASDSDASSRHSDESHPSAGSAGILGEVKSMMDRFMVRGSHGPMQWMLDLRTYGLKIHYNTTTEGHVDWLGDQILYKQVQFSMADFRGMVHGLVERTRELLFDGLMFRNDSVIGAEALPRIPWPRLRDNPVEIQRGWNFIQDERNAWGVDHCTKWLWCQIGKNPQIQEEFVQFHGDGSQWNRPGVDRYMGQIVEFREKLLVLMHFTGGQPARAPEILSVRHCNTTRGEHRNVYIENGLIVFVTRGHKGYSMKGDVKVIHRYLPREVGGLAVYYLLLVLPFQQRLELAVWKKEEVSAFLWPADPQGRQFTSERMRKCMKRETEAGMGVGLTIQMYREISIAMSRRWVRKQDAFRMDEEDEDGDWNEDDSHAIADEQAGHTSHVAGMIYARGVMERSGEVASKRQRFREASESWHEFLGFASTIDRVQSSGKRKIAPFQAEAEDARMVRWKRMRKVDIHQELRRLMGLNCQFRGIQEPAIQAIMEGKSPVVAVMGTGGGKSLLFMLPASCGGGGTSIVVVPLIALRENLKGRCEKMGIRCAEWNSKRPPDAVSIVLVTPESAVSDGFRTFINRLRATQRLDRIVIDECHIVLNNQWNFRKEMQQLGDLVGAESAMVLLTATLPPSKEADLWHRMHFQPEEVQMFGARTTRKNVRYQIMIDPSRKQGEQDEFVRRLVQQKSRRWSSGKMIVYCNSVKKSQRLAAMLACPVYHHHVTEKAEKLQGFMQGAISMMVATSSLGLGLDVSNIRVIIHVDRPRSLLDYTQESGRAGRDGLFSEAIIVKTTGWSQDGGSIGSNVEQGLVDRLMSERIEGGKCRRVVLDEYMDGVGDRMMCEDDEAKCDICRGSTREADEREEGDFESMENDIDDVAEEQEAESEMINDSGENEGGSQSGDEAEDVYRRQQQQRQQMRQRQQVRASQEGSEIEELGRQLRRWHGRCPMCFGRAEEDRHELMECEQERSRAAQEVYRRTRAMIRYEKYSCCFRCGLPQGLCQRYEQRTSGGFWQLKARQECQYPEVVMSTLIGLMVGGGADVGGEVIERMRAEGVDSGIDEEVNQWFGGKIRWGGLECNRMTREFYRVVSQVEKREGVN